MYHGIRLSLRHLKRLIKKIGRKRRVNPSDLRDVISALNEKFNKSGDTAGYRQMTQRLQVDHQLVVGRETVRELLKICDPERVERRSKHRLKRRRYVNKDPNYLGTWMDTTNLSHLVFVFMALADALCGWKCHRQTTTPPSCLSITLTVLSNWEEYRGL